MRVSLFILFIVSIFFFPLSLTLIFGFIYACLYAGYELVVIGAFVDATFGQSGGTNIPLYTLSLTGVTLAALVIVPYLNIRFRNP